MWKDPSRGNQNFQVRYVMSDGWGEPVQVNRRPGTEMSFPNMKRNNLESRLEY